MRGAVSSSDRDGRKLRQRLGVTTALEVRRQPRLAREGARVEDQVSEHGHHPDRDESSNYHLCRPIPSQTGLPNPECLEVVCVQASGMARRSMSPRDHAELGLFRINDSEFIDINSFSANDQWPLLIVRVDLGGFPPRPPTDPDVQVSSIRFLS